MTVSLSLSGRRCRWLSVIFSAALFSAGLAGCGGSGTATVAGQDTIVVGVKADQPGLGLRDRNGNFSGFEVDAGTYIARRLGASRVTFKEVTSYNREQLLNDHTVDLVLASYSITPQRAALVTFGGPYFMAHQDTMVLSGPTSIHGVHDLAGRRLCRAAGSVSSSRIVETLAIRANLVDAASYSECYSKLLAGQVDAISTGNLVLAGFAAQSNGAVSLLHQPFTNEPYGVGLRKGDIDGCEAVNKAITAMYRDGTALTLLKKWFGSSGLLFTDAIPQLEGCS